MWDLFQVGWETEVLWKKGDQIVRLVKEHRRDWPATSVENIFENEE